MKNRLLLLFFLLGFTVAYDHVHGTESSYSPKSQVLRVIGTVLGGTSSGTVYFEGHGVNYSERRFKCQLYSHDVITSITIDSVRCSNGTVYYNPPCICSLSLSVMAVTVDLQ